MDGSKVISDFCYEMCRTPTLSNKRGVHMSVSVILYLHFCKKGKQSCSCLGVIELFCNARCKEEVDLSL
jgi:hypothetical protein